MDNSKQLPEPRMEYDYERYGRWVIVSFVWIKNPETDGGIPWLIQRLGYIDSIILSKRPKDYYKDGKPITDIHHMMHVEQDSILAHLWVLGAYELIRMIDARIRDNPNLADEVATTAVKETKRLFERVRVPIAKLEPANRHEETDYKVSLAGIGEKGFGWKVSEEVTIYQNDLSEKLFTALTNLRFFNMEQRRKAKEE